MKAYAFWRILGILPTLAVVSLLVFGLLRFAPGDTAAIIAGPFATKVKVDELRESLGLNKPLVVQLGIWYKDLLRGHLGESVVGGHSVASLIRGRIVPTMSLALLTEALAVILAVPLGVLAAWKANTWIDRVVMVFSTMGFSIPLFWLGFILIYVLAVQVGFFPVAGYVSPFEDLAGFFRRMALPVSATAIGAMALIARMTRATVLETLREDYVRTARAKGLEETVVLLRHALRNAILPILTVIGFGFGLLLGGVIVTEQVFAIPGLGRLLVDAIKQRDYPVIQGTILFVSVIYVFVNLLVDLLYAYFDPRIRY